MTLLSIHAYLILDHWDCHSTIYFLLIFCSLLNVHLDAQVTLGLLYHASLLLLWSIVEVSHSLHWYWPNQNLLSPFLVLPLQIPLVLGSLQASYRLKVQICCLSRYFSSHLVKNILIRPIFQLFCHYSWSSSQLILYLGLYGFLDSICLICELSSSFRRIFLNHGFMNLVYDCFHYLISTFFEL